MGRPKLEKIEKMMEIGEDFELSNQQYKAKTEAEFPKDKYYAEKKSAVAKVARKYGFRIEVIPQRIKFQKLRKSTLIFVIGILLALVLCACNGENLDEIQEMMVDDSFVYTDGPDTFYENQQLGIKLTSQTSGLMEFYEDGTFYIGTVEQRCTYDDGELVYYDDILNMYRSYQITEKFYGTFELKYDEEDNKEIVVVLNITRYEKYTSPEGKEEIDEQYTDTKEYHVHLDDGIIQSIGFYDSVNYPLLAAIN
jgi:hypothetical protein